MKNYLYQLKSGIFPKNNPLHLSIMNSFFLLIVPAIVSGPFLADLFCVIIAVNFLFISLKKKLWNYYNNIFVFLILFFSTYIIIRSLLADNITHSLSSSLFYFRFIFFALGVQYIIINNNLIKKYFLHIFIFTFSIVLIDGFVQYFFHYNLLLFVSPEPNRLSGFFRDEMILGSFLSRFFPFLFCFIVFFKNPSKIKITVFIIILILSDILVFLSGERSAFFYILLVTLMAIILIQRLKVIRIYTFIISIVCIFLVSVFDQTTRNRMINQTINEFHEVDDNNKFNLKYFTQAHQEHFLTAFKMFQDNILFGQGPKMYRILCDQPPFDNIDTQCMTANNTSHPHNTYIQLISETGLVGFLCIFIIFCCLLFCLSKQFFYMYFLRKNYISDYRTSLLLALMVSLWPIIPTGNFFNNWLSVIYYLPVGFIFADMYKNKFFNI